MSTMSEVTNETIICDTANCCSCMDVTLWNSPRHYDASHDSVNDNADGSDALTGLPVPSTMERDATKPPCSVCMNCSINICILNISSSIV